MFAEKKEKNISFSSLPDGKSASRNNKTPLLVEIIRADEIFVILKMKNNKSSAAAVNSLR